MTDEPLAAITRHDARQVAQVLEGIAGTLREGFPLGQEDLEAAAQDAEWVWRAGPKPDPEQDEAFEAAREEFERASTAFAQGDREPGALDAAARRMAGHLRELAEDAAGALP
jgi:hypothetical protein